MKEREQQQGAELVGDTIDMIDMIDNDKSGTAVNDAATDKMVATNSNHINEEPRTSIKLHVRKQIKQESMGQNRPDVMQLYLYGFCH
jgi:hypothetical protein